MTSLTPDTVETLAALVRDGAEAQPLPTGAYYVVHSGDGNLHHIDLTGDEHRDYPRRIDQTVALTHVDSLLAYWDKHSDTSSEVYADRERRTITAIIDAHHPKVLDAAESLSADDGERARWQTHRAALALAYHDALKAWTGKDGQILDQEVFVDFLDEHSTWIATPPPAVLIQIVRELRASVGAEAQASYDPATGARTIGYSQQIKTRTVSGELDLPESITLRLPAWRGAAEPVEITARLRTRIQNNALRLGYKLINLTELIDAAFEAEVARVEAHIGRPVLRGTPAGA